MIKIKDKYYKRLEQDLYNYKYLKLSIDNIKQDIEEYERADGVGAIDFDRIQISSTNAFSSIVENATISNMEKLDFLEHCMNKADSVIKKIDKAMELLEVTEYSIVTSYYIDNLQWFEVGYKVHMSERGCRYVRSEALRKMAISIYGETAVCLPT
jgi:hypothetical protein